MNRQQENTTVEKPKEEINELLDRVNDYIRTTVELNKMKLGAKSATMGARVIHRAVGIVLLLLVVLSFTMSMGFLLGEWLGKTYLGFLLLTGLYALIFLIFYLMREKTESKISDNIIKEMFK